MQFNVGIIYCFRNTSSSVATSLKIISVHAHLMLKVKNHSFTCKSGFILCITGVPLTDPKYFANITKEDFSNILRSDSEEPIPLLDERLTVLREAGQVLLKKYDGDFANVIQQCEKSAQALLKLVVTDFSSYRFESMKTYLKD